MREIHTTHLYYSDRMEWSHIIAEYSHALVAARYYIDLFSLFTIIANVVGFHRAYAQPGLRKDVRGEYNAYITSMNKVCMACKRDSCAAVQVCKMVDAVGWMVGYNEVDVGYGERIE